MHYEEGFDCETTEWVGFLWMLTGAACSGAGGTGEAADPGSGEWECPPPEGHSGEGRAGDPHCSHQL